MKCWIMNKRPVVKTENISLENSPVFKVIGDLFVTVRWIVRNGKYFKSTVPIIKHFQQNFQKNLRAAQTG